MHESETKMLVDQWDKHHNEPRNWRVFFDLDGSEHAIEVTAASFVDASNRFLMEKIRPVRFQLIDNEVPSHRKWVITVQIGPEIEQDVEVTAVDQYGALHKLTTDEIRVMRVEDAEASIKSDRIVQSKPVRPGKPA